MEIEETVEQMEGEQTPVSPSIEVDYDKIAEAVSKRMPQPTPVAEPEKKDEGISLPAGFDGMSDEERSAWVMGEIDRRTKSEIASLREELLGQWQGVNANQQAPRYVDQVMNLLDDKSDGVRKVVAETLEQVAKRSPQAFAQGLSEDDLDAIANLAIGKYARTKKSLPQERGVDLGEAPGVGDSAIDKYFLDTYGRKGTKEEVAEIKARMSMVRA